MKLIEKKINDVELSIILEPENDQDIELLKRFKEMAIEQGIDEGDLLEQILQIAMETWNSDPNIKIDNTFFIQVSKAAMERLKQIKKFQ